MIYKKVLLLISIFSLIYPLVEVEYLEGYYDKKNEEVFLMRPRISSKGEDGKQYISAEIYSTIKNKNFKSQIVVFEKGSDCEAFYMSRHRPSSDFDPYPIAVSELLNWSKERKLINGNPKMKHGFFYVNDKSTKNKNEQCLNLGFMEFNKLGEPLYIKDDKINKFYLGDERFQNYPHPIMKKLDIQASLIFDYKEIPGDDKNRIFISYESKDGNMYLKSQDNKRFKNKGIVFKGKNKIVSFDVYKREKQYDKNYYNFVYQKYHGINHQIKSFVVCDYEEDFSKNGEIMLSPYSDEGKHQQTSPRFNYNGTKIAYLSTVDDSKLGELYVVDFTECKFDASFFNKYEHHGHENMDWIKVDKDIVSDEEYNDEDKRTDYYCWHPKKNIIFYIKKEFIGERETYPIYYYDFDDKSQEPKKLDLPTEQHKNLSFSDDGEYLVFTYQGMYDGTRYKFHNTEYATSETNNTLGNSGFQMVGLAKLNFND